MVKWKWLLQVISGLFKFLKNMCKRIFITLFAGLFADAQDEYCQCIFIVLYGDGIVAAHAESGNGEDVRLP